MLSRILLFFIPIFLLISSSSCDSFEKVLKSEDFDYKYEKAKEYYNEGDYYKSRVLLEELISYYKGSKSVEDLYYYYSWCYYGDKEYLSAAYYFKRFVDVYGNSEHAEESLFMVAKSYSKMSPRAELDQTNTIKAIESFELFVNSYPNSSKVAESNALIDEMRKKMEEKSIANADLYFKISDFAAAAHDYQNVLLNFPETTERERLSFMILKSKFHLAEKSIESKKEHRFNETITTYLKFIDSYKDSEYLREAESYYTASNTYIKELK